jgi:hypothetical protein
MHQSGPPWDPSNRVLRQFVALGMALLAGLAWGQLRRGNGLLASACLAVAVLAGPAALARPRLARPLFVGWMILASPVGWAVSRLALALLYYGVVTPLGLLLRLAGRDALGRRYEPGLASYWVARPEPELSGYFRSF